MNQLNNLNKQLKYINEMAEKETSKPLYNTTGLAYYGTRRYEVPKLTSKGDTLITSYGSNGNVRTTRSNGDYREIISNGYYDLNSGHPVFVETELIDPDKAAKFDQEASRNTSERSYETTGEWLSRKWDNLKNRFRAAFSDTKPIELNPFYKYHQNMRPDFNQVYQNGGQVTNWLQSIPENKCGGEIKKSFDGSKMKDIFAAVEACGGKMKKKK